MSKQHNVITARIIIGPSGTAVFLITIEPIVASTFQSAVVALPLNVLALAMSAGIAIPTISTSFNTYKTLTTKTSMQTFVNPTVDS